MPAVCYNCFRNTPRDGLGVKRNYDSALYWFGKAVDAGRTKSKESIQNMVKNKLVRAEDAARWLK